MNYKTLISTIGLIGLLNNGCNIVEAGGNQERYTHPANSPITQTIQAPSTKHAVPRETIEGKVIFENYSKGNFFESESYHVVIDTKNGPIRLYNKGYDANLLDSLIDKEDYVKIEVIKWGTIVNQLNQNNDFYITFSNIQEVNGKKAEEIQ